MNTFLNYLTVLAVAALLLGPSLYGLLREHRVDRRIRAAQQRLEVVRYGPRTRRARPRTARVALRNASGE